MKFTIPVVRKSVAVLDITVEADTLEQALDKALEQAPNEDFTGHTQDYEYEVDRSQYETCVLCGAHMPDIQQAIELGWHPDFWDDEEHCDGPVCPQCQAAYLTLEEESGEFVLKPIKGEFISKWDSGHEIHAPCTVNMRTRVVSADPEEVDESVGALLSETVIIDGKTFQVCSVDDRNDYSVEEQRTMFFWE